jgi:hypothetical protein
MKIIIIYWNENINGNNLCKILYSLRDGISHDREILNS